MVVRARIPNRAAHELEVSLTPTRVGNGSDADGLPRRERKKQKAPARRKAAAPAPAVANPMEVDEAAPAARRPARSNAWIAPAGPTWQCGRD